MAGNTKRFWKIQEFTAHNANVNCLALGHKSGHVLVTGGDDKKVNLWAISKTNCIMSLSGHTSPVETVKFNQMEELVAAGSSAGVLKIWDLEAVKIVRTLTGHRSGLRSVDFHPYGNFLTSSSLDSSVKVWDVRRKGCIFTFKGHSQGVNSVKFSPDGHWVASGGEDGLVKLWEIRAGRELHEFVEHSGPVTSVEFHPNEFLLTSASTDKTVNFYDLESFCLVSTSERETLAIRCVSFNSDGNCLYGGGQDCLKVMGWEPAHTLEIVPINWGRVQDITTGFSNNKLVGASFQLSSVALWMVDLTRVSPLGDSSSLPPSPFSYGQNVRKSFTKKPSPEKTPISVKTIEEMDKIETDPEDNHQVDIANIQDYRSIFQPRSSLNRSPPPSLVAPPVSDEDMSLPTIHLPSVPPPSLLEPPPPTTPPKTKSPPPPPSPRRRVPSPSLAPPSKLREPVRRLSSCKDPELSTSPDSEFPVRLNVGIQHSPSEPSLASVRSPGHSRTGSVGRNFQSQRHTSSTSTSTSSNNHKTEINNQNRVNNNVIASSTRTENDEKDSDFIPMSLEKPSGLNMEDFLPQRLQQTFPDMSEAEVFSSINRGHDYIVNILKSRERQLQIVYHLWHNKDLKTAVDHALTLRDLSVIVDLLGVIILRPGIWNLDLCASLLPAISELLQSKFEMYMTVGADALKLILHTFTPVIKSNVTSPAPTYGVDISKEERYKKCMKCYNSLVSIRALMLKRQTMQGKLGHTFRELQILLQALDS